LQKNEYQDQLMM